MCKCNGQPGGHVFTPKEHGPCHNAPGADPLQPPMNNPSVPKTDEAFAKFIEFKKAIRLMYGSSAPDLSSIQEYKEWIEEQEKLKGGHD